MGIILAGGAANVNRDEWGWGWDQNRQGDVCRD
jgi:hypothetical protein